MTHFVGSKKPNEFQVMRKITNVANGLTCGFLGEAYQGVGLKDAADAADAAPQILGDDPLVIPKVGGFPVKMGRFP